MSCKIDRDDGYWTSQSISFLKPCLDDKYMSLEMVWNISKSRKQVSKGKLKDEGDGLDYINKDYGKESLTASVISMRR